jgi:hypothetical protein
MLKFHSQGITNELKIGRGDLEDLKCGAPYDEFINKEIDSNITAFIIEIRNEKLKKLGI